MIMFRNHSYLDHKYCIRCVLLLMIALDCRVHAQGGARGQDLGHLFFFFISVLLLLLLKNDILFSIKEQGPEPQCRQSSPRLSM